MIKKYLNKLIICSLLITIIIVSVACGKSNDKKLEYDENDEIVKIDAQHTIVDEDLNIYLLVESIPAKKGIETIEMQSITIYSDFLKGNRTSRHYSYYQADYTVLDKIETYFHIFDFTTEANKRSYAQCFLPFNELNSRISNIAVSFEYSFMIEDEVFEKECSFNEKMIEYKEDYPFKDKIEGYEIYISEEKNNDMYADKEDFNRYKLNLKFSDESLNKVGHIDFAAFVKYSDGSIMPLYSLYHYNFNRGSYVSGSDSKISKEFAIEEVYYILEEHLTDGTVNKLYYKG